MMVPCGKLKPGVEAARTVVTLNQSVLLPAGTALTAEHLRALKMWGIEAIPVVGEESGPSAAGRRVARSSTPPRRAGARPAVRTSQPRPLSQHQLVASLTALGNFVGEIRSSSDREEIMALTISHLKALFPIESAGFYFPQANGLDFVLQTPLPAVDGSRLTGLVEQAIDSGEFGWTLNHSGPTVFESGDGHSTLLLAAWRTRQRVWGMFAAILRSQFAEWSANATVLATHLALAADAMPAEELTAKLQEQTQQLHEAKQAAELANQAESKFLASISHDLRTPLNAILGYTRIMLRHERPATERDQLETVQASAEHLLSMINKSLNLAHAETSALELTSQTPESGGRPVAPTPSDEAASAGSLWPAMALPPENLRALKELSADGDILELQKALAKMVGNSPHPLARRLLQLATECRVKAIRELLEAYERDHPDS